MKSRVLTGNAEREVEKGKGRGGKDKGGEERRGEKQRKRGWGGKNELKI